MTICAQTIKEKMSEFARLFSIERNIFQRFVIAYKYFTYLNTEPVIKDILQKIFDDTAKLMGEPENMDEDKFLEVKGEALYSQSFWMYYTNLEIIHGKMKKLKKCHIDDKTDCDNLKKLKRNLKEIIFKERTKNSHLQNYSLADTVEAEYLPKKNGNSSKTVHMQNISITHVAERETETVRITIYERKI